MPIHVKALSSIPYTRQVTAEISDPSRYADTMPYRRAPARPTSD